MATNALNLYDPLFYAQEGLIALENYMGMAARVHRGYDKKPQEKGSTIEINRPGTFVEQDAPSTAQNLEPGMTEIKLNFWKEVKFELTDKELAFSGEKIISDHIRPAMYSLANGIEGRVCALAEMVPWFYDAAATTEIKDLTRARKVLFDNRVPLSDGNLHFAVGSDLEAGFLELFANAQLAGPSNEAPMRGFIGNRFGIEIFGTQNVASHVKGSCSVTALLVNGAAAKGAAVINLDAAAVTGTLAVGDSFAIAGDSQRYVVTALCTAAANAFAGVQIFPPLAQAVADNAAVTVSLMNHTGNVLFHRNAFALAMAPLSDIGNQFGAKVESVFDEKSGLAMRSTMWYDPDNRKVKVAYDVLYGLKCLDANLAVRVRK